MLGSQIEAGSVTGGQQTFILLRHLISYDRADGVQHIARRQIVPSGDFCLPGGFGMTLRPHDLIAFQAQLNPCRRMDRIIDASVVGNETTQEPIVGRVDNRIHGQGGDIASPKDKALGKGDPRAGKFHLDRRQGFQAGYPFRLALGRKKPVLQFE